MVTNYLFFIWYVFISPFWIIVLLGIVFLFLSFSLLAFYICYLAAFWLPGSLLRNWWENLTEDSLYLIRSCLLLLKILCVLQQFDYNLSCCVCFKFILLIICHVLQFCGFLSHCQIYEAFSQYLFKKTCLLCSLYSYGTQCTCWPA